MSEKSTLQSQYADQVRNDLETNVAERDRVSSQIDELQAQLKVLEDNHALLILMQQALGNTATPVAETRKTPREAAPAGGQVPRARTSAELPNLGAKKQKQSATKTQARGNGPTLRDLIASHLPEAGQPVSAAEIHTTVATAHPERNIAATVVRTTLENLVAKGVAERTRQRRSVFYSRPAPGARTGTAAERQDTSSEDLAANPAPVATN
ncbi:hypothetical protein [Streptomyces violascens]|uniref:hypothetical protein n=1 Tax=Streptomyces violascens TaxID=67381 RepID=UPI0016788862|nr:hypothetical protein [Streptomyces violascens]GGU40512.1 hypothetical protein GCM10010289_71700 [Streptomyces violascens]